MAETETGAERTEEPSARRLQEARERGLLPRSRELIHFSTLIGGSAVLAAAGNLLVARLALIMRNGLSIGGRPLEDTSSMMTALGDAVIQSVVLLLPIFGALIALVLLAAVALGGWNFSPRR